MKKIVASIISLFIIAMSGYVLAGMADWDDKSADEAANKQLQEQKNELVDIVSKSTNNYLDSLSVEGYKISPSFDKQTVNYDIGKIETNTINIKATPEDEKATVNGMGTITLNNGENDIRIDVVSESGTIRTYHIKAIYNIEEEPIKEENTITNDIVENIETETKTNTEESQNTNSQNDNVKAILGIVIVALFALIVIRAIKKK